MLLKRSVSPDGRVDSLSVEFSCAVDQVSAGDIKTTAFKTLQLQAEIVDGFLAGNRKEKRAEDRQRKYWQRYRSGADARHRRLEHQMGPAAVYQLPVKRPDAEVFRLPQNSWRMPSSPPASQIWRNALMKASSSMLAAVSSQSRAKTDDT
jgi:hypothetical protein